jgi:hypothetical protein
VSPITTDNGSKRWGRIPDAMARSGMKRGYLYKLATEHTGLFRKLGTATVVDLWLLDEIMEAAPNAKLGLDEKGAHAGARARVAP